MGFFSSKKKNVSTEVPVGDVVIDWRLRFHRMFEVYDPSQLKKLDDMMSIANGREDAIMSALVKRYGPEPQTGKNDLVKPNMGFPSAGPMNPSLSKPESRSSAGPSVAVPPTNLSWDERFRRMFTAYDESQLPKLKSILQVSKGREDAVMAALVKRYGPEPELPATEGPIDKVLGADGEPNVSKPVPPSDTATVPPSPVVETNPMIVLDNDRSVVIPALDTAPVSVPQPISPSTRSESVESDPFDLSKYNSVAATSGNVVVVVDRHHQDDPFSEIEEMAPEKFSHDDDDEAHPDASVPGITYARRSSQEQPRPGGHDGYWDGTPQWEEYWDRDQVVDPPEAREEQRFRWSLPLQHSSPTVQPTRTAMAATRRYPSTVANPDQSHLWTSEMSYLISEMKRLRETVISLEAVSRSKDNEIKQLNSLVASLKTALDVVQVTTAAGRHSPHRDLSPALQPLVPSTSFGVGLSDVTFDHREGPRGGFFCAASDVQSCWSSAHPSSTRTHRSRAPIMTPAVVVDIPVLPEEPQSAQQQLPRIGSLSPQRHRSPRNVSFDLKSARGDSSGRGDLFQRSPSNAVSSGPPLENPLNHIATRFQKGGVETRQIAGRMIPRGPGPAGALVIGPSTHQDASVRVTHGDYLNIVEPFPPSSPISQLIW
jgi:hypothetical protein